MERRLDKENLSLQEEGDPSGYTTVHLGSPGPLHSSQIREIPNNSPLKDLMKDSLSFDDIVSLAAMFNFADEGWLIGQRKVVAQLDESDWSAPFSLRSIEVTQLLSVEDRTHGSLEASFKIKGAPGKLGKYTKIIRFCPRFIVVNKLPMAVVLTQRTLLEANWRDQNEEVVSGGNQNRESRASSQASMSLSVSAEHMRPFHFPGIDHDRLLAIDFVGEGCWASTPSFGLNHIGSFALRVPLRSDLSTLPYISTRLAPEYQVELPQGEVGIWFETDWDQCSIVVNGVKRGRYAYLKTDIEVGDQLIEIDGERVVGSEFDKAISTIRQKLAQGPCILRFRTVEEKFRTIREMTMLTDKTSSNNNSCNFMVTPRRPVHRSAAVGDDSDANFFSATSEFNLRVDLRMLDLSTVITLSTIEPEAAPDYRVENQCPNYVIRYKQKGVGGKRFNSLDPGTSAPYYWENPFKAHRLIVAIGSNLLAPSKVRWLSKQSNDVEENPSNAGDSLVNGFRWIAAATIADLSPSVVLFDKLGFVSTLQVPGSDAKILLRVISDGYMKVLRISPVRSFLFPLPFGTRLNP